MCTLISRRIKELRAEKDISQKELAAQLFVSPQAISKWERDEATPNPEAISKMAEIFDVSADYLLGRTDDLRPVRKMVQPAQEEKATIDVIDDDLREYLDELRTRPETRLLFSVTKNATKSQIEAIVKMVEEMQGKK